MNLYVPETFGGCVEHIAAHIQETHPEVISLEVRGNFDETHFQIVSGFHIQLHRGGMPQAKQFLYGLGFKED